MNIKAMSQQLPNLFVNSLQIIRSIFYKKLPPFITTYIFMKIEQSSDLSTFWHTFKTLVNDIDAMQRIEKKCVDEVFFTLHITVIKRKGDKQERTVFAKF